MSARRRRSRSRTRTPIVANTGDIGGKSDHIAAPPTLGGGLEHVGNEASASGGGGF